LDAAPVLSPGGFPHALEIDAAFKERALRMFAEHRQDYPSDTLLAAAVAKKVGVGRETVRRWLIQADVNTGTRPEVTSDAQAEIKRLRAEVKKLREDNEILKSTTVFFAGELDPATADHGVHRRHESRRSRGRVDLQSAH
jgi:transposase-like protein